jgi:hypothetical protein
VDILVSLCIQWRGRRLVKSAGEWGRSPGLGLLNPSEVQPQRDRQGTLKRLEPCLDWCPSSPNLWRRFRLGDSLNGSPKAWESWPLSSIFANLEQFINPYTQHEILARTTSSSEKTK